MTLSALVSWRFLGVHHKTAGRTTLWSCMRVLNGGLDNRWRR
jgi:hypothetical protein